MPLILSCNRPAPSTELARMATLLTDAIGTDGFEVHLAANSEAVVMLVAAMRARDAWRLSIMTQNERTMRST
jgi:hypothetical protein